MRTYVLVLVLTYSPEYFLPQPKKLQVLSLRPIVPNTQYLLPKDSVPQSKNVQFSGCGTESQRGTY